VHTLVLDVGAQDAREDLVSDLELGNGGADRFDLSGELRSQDGASRLEGPSPSRTRNPNPFGADRERSLQSAAVTVVAWTLIRTSWSSGVGFGISLSSRTSGGPYLS